MTRYYIYNGVRGEGIYCSTFPVYSGALRGINLVILTFLFHRHSQDLTVLLLQGGPSQSGPSAL